MELWVGSMIGGVIGAVIGHGANHFFGWLKENKQSSPERKFICAELVFLLEDYASKCTEVSRDDGEPNGEQGEYEPVAGTPSPVDYSMVKGNWRSLSSQMMYEVCSLPMIQQNAIKAISFASEYFASPPDYPEYFEERKFQFAKLGLKAAKVADEIRRQNNFPPSELEIWAIPAMEETLAKITAKRQKHNDEEDFDFQ